MASATTIKAVGDWKAQMTVPLNRAIEAQNKLYKRTAPAAAKAAVVMMAQTAGRETPKAPKNRPIKMHQGIGAAKYRRYIETYNKRGEMTKVFQHQFNPNSPRPLDGTWVAAKRIKSSGLASRSWMWQLKPGKGSGPVGSSSVSAFKVGENKIGYVKRNKLDYINKIMKSGWKERAATSATNRIMNRVAAKMEKDNKRELEKIRKVG